MLRDFVLADNEGTTACLETRPISPAAPREFLFLHGGGATTKERFSDIMVELARAGYRSVAFDARGQGASSGNLPKQSLESRCAQAERVIERCLHHNVIAVGFSMGGQTVTDLMARTSRIVGAVLGAPAAYARKAWTVPFGDGFSSLIRKPESWRSSTAFDAIGSSAIPVRLLLPQTDNVIPGAVRAAYVDAVTTSPRGVAMSIPHADHKLATWFAENGDRRNYFRDLLLNGLTPVM